VAREKTVAEIAQELWELLRAYAIQETVDPLKKLGGYLAWGAGGSLLFSIGGFFLSLGLLRLLQTQTGDTFGGDWSWVPYLIVGVVLTIFIVLSVRRITRAQQREHRKAA
jgi:ABC-type transport system involved in cytochrome c biogenesis permease subunit